MLNQYTQKLYDAYAAAYEQESHTHEAEINVFLSEAELKDGESVLNIGCGNDKLTLGAKKLVGNGTVIGVDISAKMLSGDV